MQPFISESSVQLKAKANLLIRACNFKTAPLHIVDCTAGLGTDAIGLALQGATVTLIEREPAIFALLQKRLKNFNLSNIRLVAGDACDILAKIDQKIDRCYLDPMFSPRRTTALPKKEIQFINQFASYDEREQMNLLQVALKFGEKVIIKRHSNHPVLLPKQLNAQYKGKMIRFDVYLKTLDLKENPV